MRIRLIASLVSALVLAGGVAAGPSAGAQAPQAGSAPVFGAGVVRLEGAQEVPPADPDGRGTFAYIAFDHTLCYVLTARRIEPSTMAHIHVGARGVNGPIVIGLVAPTRGVSADCIAAQPEGTPGDADVLLESELAQIIANPAAFYTNVHNTPFPGGAIRGQLR
jgi:hypothetical protein